MDLHGSMVTVDERERFWGSDRPIIRPRRCVVVRLRNGAANSPSAFVRQYGVPGTSDTYA